MKGLKIQGTDAESFRRRGAEKLVPFVGKIQANFMTRP
jgi:hypothetical protein